MDFELMAQADELLREDKSGYTWSGSQYLSTHPSFDRVQGTVHYVGCGRDCSPLFLFEQAGRFIYQDMGNFPIEMALRSIEKTGEVAFHGTKTINPWMRETAFSYKGIAKTVLEIHGGHPERDINLTEGDIALTVPDEPTEALYFKGMPYPDSVKVMQLQALPILRLEGLCVGPVFGFGGTLIGIDPALCGLDRVSIFDDNILRKKIHLSTRKLEQASGTSVEDYIKGHLRSSWPRVDRNAIYREEFSDLRRKLGLLDKQPAGTISYSSLILD